MVSGHTFRALIHFVCGVKKFSNFKFFFTCSCFLFFPSTTVGELTLVCEVTSGLYSALCTCFYASTSLF